MSRKTACYVLAIIIAILLSACGSADSVGSSEETAGLSNEEIERFRCEEVYTEAIALCDAGEYREAIPLFQSIAGYEDVNAILRSIIPHTTIAAGFEHSVALKNDGTVVAVGGNRWGQCDVDSWTGITQISRCDFTTVGLKADGTVVATGYNHYGQCDVQNWTDTAIAAGSDFYGQCNTGGWMDIKIPLHTARK